MLPYRPESGDARERDLAPETRDHPPDRTQYVPGSLPHRLRPAAAVRWEDPRVLGSDVRPPGLQQCELKLKN